LGSRSAAGAVAGWNEAFEGLHGVGLFRADLREAVFQDFEVDARKMMRWSTSDGTLLARSSKGEDLVRTPSVTGRDHARSQSALPHKSKDCEGL
jgi:hypothetical protein